MKIFATLLFTSTVLFTYAQDVRTIRVVNSKNLPVKCKMYFNNQDMGYANYGEFSVPANCAYIDKIDIEPVDIKTYDGRKGIHCHRVKDYIVLFKHQEKQMALSNAFFMENISLESLEPMEAKDKTALYGRAALASNEIYQLDIYPDSIRNKARVRALMYTAQALDIKEGLYMKEKYAVANTTLITAVESYQQSNGLKVTGKIDGETLQMLANTNSHAVLTTDFESKAKSIIKKMKGKR